MRVRLIVVLLLLSTLLPADAVLGFARSGPQLFGCERRYGLADELLFFVEFEIDHGWGLPSDSCSWAGDWPEARRSLKSCARKASSVCSRWKRSGSR